MKGRVFLCGALLLALLSAGGCTQDNIKTSIPDALDKRVGDEILKENSTGYRKGEFQTEAHALLGAVEKDGKVTVYLYVLYSEYDHDSTDKFVDVSGGSNPAALTFQKDEESYTLTEYWIPKDGSGYASSIKEKFPGGLYESAMDPQKYGDTLKKECDGKATAYLAAKG